VSEVLVALGSNIAPAERMAQAARLLNAAFPGVRFSACYQNPAAGFSGDDFINAAAVFDTPLPAEPVRVQLQGIEEACGRHRDDAKWAPRAMDLDILLFGDLISNAPGLQLPRGDLLRRAYMLGPAAELLPQRVHPVARRTLAELWRELAPTCPPLTRIALDLNAA
jgi:2-amino-4-hydroxy-6-hydroxymethyldihydropteridine diphosphokinase